MYIKTTGESRHGRKDLVRKLATELKKPHAKKVKNVPIIREEQARFSERFQVFVIWDAWRGVQEEIRGQVIADAYEQAFGKRKAAKLSLTVGVTPAEARELGMSELGRGANGDEPC